MSASPASATVSAPPLAIDWARWLRPGDHVVCSHMTSEPVALLQSLAQADLPQPLHVLLGVPFSGAAAGLPTSVQLATFGGMGSAGQLARKHTLEISLMGYGECARRFADIDSGLPVDVLLVSLARSDDGTLYLGASEGYALATARRARCIIAEVNAQAPCVLGSPWPDDLPPHALVNVDYPLVEVAEAPPGELEHQLATHVASLVPDGACLQVGIGAMPSAVLAKLDGHRHLGAHTGMLSEAMFRLIEQGAMDHSRKSIDAGVAVTGSLYGSQRLYRFAHLNPTVALRDPTYTHGPDTIARLENFFALNSAIEVDLLGQANTETVSGRDGQLRYVGGVGGLNDFVRAARLAPRGQAVLALPSRTAPGPQGRPRIVARLSGPATVAASDADTIVTEHGVARLRDASLRERVQQMISIAAPEDRENLESAARGYGWLSRS